MWSSLARLILTLLSGIWQIPSLLKQKNDSQFKQNSSGLMIR